MFPATEESTATLTNSYCGPAEIIECARDCDQLHVRLTSPFEMSHCWVRIALPEQPAFEVGDAVLVTGNAPDNFYVIGVLSTRRAKRNAASRLHSQSGASAELAGGADSEMLRVLDPAGQLLFEYDPTRNQARVCIPDGDLQVLTPNGGIELAAGHDIRLRGRLIDVSGRRGVRVAVVNALGKALSALTLQKRKARLESPQLGMESRRAELEIGETQFRGQRVFAHIDWVKTVADRSETVARIVIEQADNAYRTVKELAQLTAGRARTFVASICQFKTGKAYFKADEDFKIQGDKIHLG